MSAKANRIINIFTIISASFTFICYIFYILGGTVLADSGGLFVTVFIICISTLPIIFAKFIKKITGKFYGILKILYCCCLSLYMIFFLIFSGIITFHSESKPTFDSRQSVIIVHGSKINGCTPDDMLRSRLDVAYDLLIEQPDAICIVSGGQGDDETISEAQCMRVYLEDKGISPSRIYLEDRSRNTKQNIEYSIKVMTANNISLESNIICVSSDFHTARITLVAKDYGLDVQCAAADSPSVIIYFSSLVREFMSYVKYFIFR